MTDIVTKRASVWFWYEMVTGGTKILENGKISYNKKSLNKFRIHAGSVTNNSKKTEQHRREIIEMHQAFRKRYDLSKKILTMMKNEIDRIKP
jgi:hypothetical protein